MIAIESLYKHILLTIEMLIKAPSFYKGEGGGVMLMLKGHVWCKVCEMDCAEAMNQYLEDKHDARQFYFSIVDFV